MKRSGLDVLARLARLEERKRQRALGQAREAALSSEQRERTLVGQLALATLPAALRAGATSAAQLRTAGERAELLRTSAALAASEVARLRAELDTARASLAQATLRARALRDVAARRARDRAREQRRIETRRAEARPRVQPQDAGDEPDDR